VELVQQKRKKKLSLRGKKGKKILHIVHIGKLITLTIGVVDSVKTGRKIRAVGGKTPFAEVVERQSRQYV